MARGRNCETCSFHVMRIGRGVTFECAWERKEVCLDTPKGPQVGGTRLLQLPCGARKPHEPGRVSRSRAGSLVAYATSPQPETPGVVDAYSRFCS